MSATCSVHLNWIFCFLRLEEKKQNKKQTGPGLKVPLNPGLQNQVETAAAGWRSDVLWLEPIRIFLSSESRAGLHPFGLWRRAGTFPLWLMKRPIHQPGPATFPPDREADAAPDGGLKGTRCSPRRPLFKSTQTRFSFVTVTNVQEKRSTSESQHEENCVRASV